MTPCPECGYPVSDNDRECGKCGETLAPPRCLQCNHREFYDPEAKSLCSNCGAIR